MKNKTGTVFVVSGPSGTGKGTIMNEYFKKYPNDNCFLSISATTREPRDGEVDGINYHFKSEEAFQEMIDSDGFVEWADFCDFRYGTPKAPVEDNIADGVNVILEIEVQGAKKIMNRIEDAVGIFVLPPSFEELRRRLTTRNTETADVIEKRLERAKKEFEEIKNYDYIIINDDIDDAVETFRSILIGETQRIVRNKKILEEVFGLC